jgi:hypothetical protein
MITLAVFIFFAVLAVVAALLVVIQKNAMHSVLYLAFTVLATAGVFFALQAEYLGAIQILVYGGGIVVLYIFVIIIVNLGDRPERWGLPWLLVGVLSFGAEVDTLLDWVSGARPGAWLGEMARSFPPTSALEAGVLLLPSSRGHRRRPKETHR